MNTRQAHKDFIKHITKDFTKDERQSLKDLGDYITNYLKKTTNNQFLNSKTYANK